MSCRESLRFFCRDVVKVLALFPCGNKAGWRRGDRDQYVPTRHSKAVMEKMRMIVNWDQH